MAYDDNHDYNYAKGARELLKICGTDFLTLIGYSFALTEQMLKYDGSISPEELAQRLPTLPERTPKDVMFELHYALNAIDSTLTERLEGEEACDTP